MSNEDIECLISEYGTKYYILKNSELGLTDKNIKMLNKNVKILYNKYYYKNKLIHRKNEPAIEYSTGETQYYINGSKISEENFYLEKELRESIINNNISKKNKI